MIETLLAIGETIDGELSFGAEILGKQAGKLATVFGGAPLGVLLGHSVGRAAQRWAETAGMDVIGVEHPDCRYPNPEMAVSMVRAMAEEMAPIAVCFPNSVRASQTAAMLAWQLKSPLVTAVHAVSNENGRFALKRSVFGGKLQETVSVKGRPLIMTLMPGVFPDENKAPAGTATGRVEIRPAAGSGTSYRPLVLEREEATDQALEKAAVVVAGGRGLGGPEHVELLDAVAGMFKKSAVGGSRGACDLGWLPHSRQIGETGRTVAPALYLACGISGAPQHLAGMRASQHIVAVNKDPNAAILNTAHFAVIADLAEFLPVLIERYQNRRHR